METLGGHGGLSGTAAVLNVYGRSPRGPSEWSRSSSSSERPGSMCGRPDSTHERPSSTGRRSYEFDYQARTEMFRFASRVNGGVD